MNFHTKFALSRLLAGQCEVEKKLMTKLQSRLQPFGEHAPPKSIEATCNIYLIRHICQIECKAMHVVGRV